MISYWAYILVGDNATGKTTFQRNVIELVCGYRYERLPRNLEVEITNARFPRNVRKLFAANRSLQEQDLTVEDYFTNEFKDSGICILSSHSSGSARAEIEQMIHQLRRRYYNIAGVFLENSSDNENSREIGTLPFNELLWLPNPSTEDPKQWDQQLKEAACNFVELLLRRSHLSHGG